MAPHEHTSLFQSLPAIELSKTQTQLHKAETKMKATEELKNALCPGPGPRKFFENTMSSKTNKTLNQAVRYELTAKGKLQ